VAGTGWGTSGNLDSTTTDDIYDPHVTMDGGGDATAIWYQWELAGINIRLNRCLPGSGSETSRALSAFDKRGHLLIPCQGWLQIGQDKQ